jgi:glycosyltransferase involved in cell wall biosynthesis
MTAAPVASIVVPAYNSARTVEDTIRSLLRQTFTDFEVIVVDDGSTDHTAEVVARFSDPRLRLIRQPNRGLAGAHNTGIFHARGEYVGFCDADDLWVPEKLELHIEHLKANRNVGISFSGSMLIDEFGRSLGMEQKPRLKNITAAHVFKRNPIGNGSSAVIRREALDDFAYRPAAGSDRPWWFDETFRQSDDIEGWTRFALTLDWRIEGIPGALTQYRIHLGGLSANIDKQFETWARMRDKMATIAPRFVERHGPAAAAYQFRYLARRAVSMRDGAAASRLMRRSLAASVRPLYEETVKTIVTVGAAETLRVFGAAVYRWMERRALRVQTA